MTLQPDVAILCPRPELAAAIARELDGARRENWAPFHAWRGAHTVDAPSTPRELFILVCPEGPRATVPAALQLLTVFPGRPILQLDLCRACDPTLARGQILLCASATAFKKEELYLLHDAPTPLPSLPAVSPSIGPSLPGPPGGAVWAAFGSCDAIVDFPVQRKWLREKYRFDAFDTISHATGDVIRANGGRWLAAAVVAGPAGETAEPFQATEWRTAAQGLLAVLSTTTFA
mgnify:CR=1 FL=1